ncbi:Fur family transcriptional regulator [Hydrogenothermus marinus]|uniref:Ferric uptake regulation protein n=1 Tax=Hydrogenothermus marinus TaxID=133270 RepID=A0A3M0BIQ5_9AQUI|nr:transcriptional repressor [Hydrogenothermus marinus]RMA97270.1 Fur family ferric uptake transcriptional regulator [Hydrogenothermus marinus]
MNKSFAKKEFKKFIKEKGLKFTSQREKVLDEILNTKGHFEIEDIVQKIKNKNVNVSRATVYRTLNILKEIGIVTEVIKFNNKTIYEISLKEHHDHLICTNCGKIIEFQEKEIEELQDKICEIYGFKPTFHRLEIFGLCKDCASKEDIIQ